MSREIERKFLIDDIPDDLEKYDYEKILQGYLSIEKEDFEVRFRKKGPHYYQTIKKGAGLNREEIEVELTKEQFVIFWPLTADSRIVKRRIKIPYQNLTIELDIYEDKFNGLVAAEVEFTSEKEALAFEPPDWFGTEITEEISLQNNNLARHGMSPELLKKYNISLKEENIYRQSGVIPLRKNKHTEALIITSNSGKNWVFPKGIIEYGLSSEESAKKEAFEEAGVLGFTGEKIGDYEYKKWNGICRVEMFLFEKVKELNQWPEDFRDRKWVKVKKLSDFVKKKELQPIISKLQRLYN